MHKDIKSIIDKYLSDQINDADSGELLQWLRDAGNKELFKTYVQDHYQWNKGLLKIDVEMEFSKLMGKIERKANAKRKISIYRWAAIFMGLIGVSLFFYLTNIQDRTLAPEVEMIRINQGDGIVKTIEENGTQKIIDRNGTVVGNQKGNVLDYKNVEGSKATQKETLAYSELYVPFGKKMRLLLSDGTKVHVNAGSTFRYPVKFVGEGNRKVFLEGEAFFEVSKDQKRPFIVDTDAVGIEVLGTTFNISSYRDDETLSTVLAEGSVNMYHREERNGLIKDAILLSPGEAGTWKKNTGNMLVKKVDVEEYLAWTEGNLVFRTRKFSDILKILERHYNISIINNYKELDDQLFFARFDTENIGQVLSYFQKSVPFNYRMEGNSIEINDQ
ncbi:MAG: FecR domain-containing protein [Sediminicola sp.]